MGKRLSGFLLVLASAAIQHVHAADYSAGVKGGSNGGGVSFSLKNTLQIRSDD